MSEPKWTDLWGIDPDFTTDEVEDRKRLDDLGMVCDAYGLPHDAVALARHIESNRALTAEMWKAAAATLNRRIDHAAAFVDLLHKAHAVCEGVVMDTPEERELHATHCAQMRDLDSAILGALAGKGHTNGHTSESEHPAEPPC